MCIFLIIPILIVTATQSKAENITPLEYKEGVTRYESEAIATGLVDLITENFRYWFTESHFPFGQYCSTGEENCRQNLNFEVTFSTASLDLNSDGIDEVIVRYNGPGYCGSGGCHSYILKKYNSGFAVIGKFFPGTKVEISSNRTEGYADIYYHGKGKTTPFVCKYSANQQKYQC